MPHYKLEDLDVREVSVVDRGANKRSLLVIKNAEGAVVDGFEQAVADAQNGVEVAGDDLTQPDDPSVAVEKAPDTFDDPVVAAQAAKAEQETELAVSLPVEMRDALIGVFDGVAKRVMALGEAVKASQPGEGGVSDKFKSELLDLSLVLRQVSGAEKADDILRIGKRAEPVVPDLTKSVEYVMTPQGPAMMLPPEDMMRVAADMAARDLMCAESYLWEGNFVGALDEIHCAVKAIAPFVASPAGGGEGMSLVAAVNANGGAVASDKQYATNQPQPSIPAGVPSSQPPAGMAKAGRKIAGDRLALLEDALAKLSQAIADVRGVSVETTKNDQVVPRHADVVKTQKAEIERPAAAPRPLGNATQFEESTAPTKSERITWPDDLNSIDDDSDLK